MAPMEPELRSAIDTYLRQGGCSDKQIADGVACAEKVGYGDWDDALSVALGHILYSSEDGEVIRAPVEPGEWYA